MWPGFHKMYGAQLERPYADKVVSFYPTMMGWIRVKCDQVEQWTANAMREDTDMKFIDESTSRTCLLLLLLFFFFFFFFEPAVFCSMDIALPAQPASASCQYVCSETVAAFSHKRGYSHAFFHWLYVPQTLWCCRHVMVTPLRPPPRPPPKKNFDPIASWEHQL
jgi:hypothetical protein